MPTFSIEEDCGRALAGLFEVGQDGHLRFGWQGRSIRPAARDDLLAGPIPFLDYIMEGFLTYTIQAEDLKPGCLLKIRGEGSNRDRYIRPQVRHVITAAGFSIAFETDD